MKIRNIIIIAFIACVFACTPILLSFSEIRNGSWLMVKMRDGESLYTRIVYPTNYQAGESRAVILIRTPYNIQDDIYTSIANGLRNAYDSIIVLQDIRGMHGSRDAGGFEVFFSDADDGTDTVNWILQQPWCNGSIATHGASADAANQMTYHAAGAGVKAAFIHAGPSEIYDHWLLPGGCLRKNFRAVRENVSVQTSVYAGTTQLLVISFRRAVQPYRPTIGTNIFIKKVNIDDDGKGEATLTLWDVAGQERWTSMRPLYYKGASGAIVVGDVTRKSTFEQIKKFWIPDLHQHNPDKVPIVLIANKSDLQWEATKEEIDQAAKDISAVTSVITCAKTGDNVNQAFTTLTKEILGKP